MRTTWQLKIFFLASSVIIVAVAMMTSRKVSADNRAAISYNRDIRPIFSDTCFRCHGPDKNARKAGLRLDLRDEATKKTRSGVTPIVPNKPEDSEIVRRIFSNEKSKMMPPEEIHKSLTEAQKEIIKRWVAEGAKYEGHWAYQPVNRSEIPAAKIHPVDFFIQQRLQKEGLLPAPEADRRTLIRRVSLDLTGIPPTPTEVAAFVNDKALDAYEKLVDRLIASPRFAEKQAMHWLDAVRYGDTAGFHGDNAMPAWPYRDYVLRAFRNNKPFDEFTREQIAGDLLPSATDEQRIASAYNRMNRVSAEGGLQPKEYLAKYGADRVRTTSVVWLGATMGCAECHDHKFDPYLAKDFYAMKAFFADIKETGLVPDRGRTAFGSKLILATDEQRTKLNEYARLLAWYNSELDDKAKAMNARRADWEKQILQQFEAGKLTWKFARPLSAFSTNGATMKIYNEEELTTTQYLRGNIETRTIKGDGLVVVSGKAPETDVYTVTVKPGAGEWTALGLEVVQDESLPGDRFARGGDRFVVSEFEAESNGQKLNYSLATTDGFGQPVEHPAFAAIDGALKTGWGVQFGDNRNAFLNLRLSSKLKTTADSVITIRLHQVSNFRKATIGRFRIAISEAQYSWADYSSKLGAKWLQGLPPDVVEGLRENDLAKRTVIQKKAIDDHFKWMQPEFLVLNAKISRLEYERDLLDAGIPRVVVTETAAMPQETRILPRGNFLDESGEIVSPAIPQMFGKLEANGRATRLDLANWIVSKENPLTARVFVNRLWRQFFGTGLSKTLEDFGSQGEPPTHPELLDWLAAEFMHPECRGKREQGLGAGVACNVHDWDSKYIIRLLVTSHTYKQSSLSNTNAKPAPLSPTSIEDFDNRLLAHQNRFRVDAEIIRDIALSVSGLLVEQFGGPSVKPYQPEGYLLSLNFPKRDYAADRGDSLYRRGLYTHWQRSFLHPSLLAFDAPSREECTVNRVSSNTPLQALVMLNDPIYLEASRVFAQNILKQKTESQINWALEKSLGRKGSAEEIRILTDLYNKGLVRYQKDSVAANELISIGDTPVAKEFPAAKLAAMTTVARAILNLHETITRN